MSRATMWRSNTAKRKDITTGCRRWQPILFADKWPGSSRAVPLRHLLPRQRPRQFQLFSASASTQFGLASLLASIGRAAM